WARADQPWAVIVTAVREDFDPTYLPRDPAADEPARRSTGETPPSPTSETAPNPTDEARRAELLMRQERELRNTENRWNTLREHPEQCYYCRGTGYSDRSARSICLYCPAGQKLREQRW